MFPCLLDSFQEALTNEGVATVRGGVKVGQGAFSIAIGMLALATRQVNHRVLHLRQSSSSKGSTSCSNQISILFVNGCPYLRINCR